MIIDVHCHLGRSPQFRFSDTSVGTMLRVMDRLGIERAVCCHLAFLQGEPQPRRSSHNQPAINGTEIAPIEGARMILKQVQRRAPGTPRKR